MVTSRYCDFLKQNSNIYFLKNLGVTRNNPLQIAPNHAKLIENVRYRVKLSKHVALWKMYGNTCDSACSNVLKLWLWFSL